jgi:uncharacterized membrane protein (DUF485 family)
MQQPDIHSEEFLRQLLRRQLRLSISIGMVFGLVLILLPLFNYYSPELMATRIAGFTLTWLILGVLVFPLVWILSWIFIKKSTLLEQDEVNSVQNPNKSND